MGFFNLGKKDDYGKQRRIEHRGRYLRASRTGGVSLRAQAKAAGMNVTANTSRGFRVSTTPMENTQVALQNGRFVLRGRYGKGPTKLNVSKTGATISTRNRLGTFNWIKPNRSSAKIAGIQVRGKNAANLQIFYMLITGAFALLQLVFLALVWLFQAAVMVGGVLYRLALATPYALAVTKRRIRNGRLQRRLPVTRATLEPDLHRWTPSELVAGLVVVLAGWGRGQTAQAAAESLDCSVSKETGNSVFQEARDVLHLIARRLEVARESGEEDAGTEPGAYVALLARQLAERLEPDALAETVLAMDEWALEQGTRTVLEEELLQVCADFAGLRFQEARTGAESASNALETGPSASG